MKKIITAVALVVSAYGFSANCVEENVNSEIVSIEFEKNISYDEFFGMCHIQIIETKTGKVVYEISLPANDAEQCEHMAEKTLEAVENGDL